MLLRVVTTWTNLRQTDFVQNSTSYAWLHMVLDRWGGSPLAPRLQGYQPLTNPSMAWHKVMDTTRLALL